MQNESAKTPAPPPDWQRIINSIRETGLSQEAIATRLGVTQGTVSNLITGRTKKVEYVMGESILSLARELGCASATDEQAAA